MKTKNVIKLAAILIAVIGISFAGCKKEKNDEVNTTSLQQLTKDENMIQGASDDVLNDANNVLSGGGKSILGLPCNVTIDSATIIGDTIIYHLIFHGANCAGTVLRYGDVYLKKNINTHWYQAGATVAVKFVHLKLTKVASGKSVIISGSKVFTNVSGGFIVNLNGSNSVVYKITGSITAKFEDSTTRVWNIARQRTFTGTFPGQLVETTDGFGAANGYSSLVVWGTNRDGEDFYTQITQSVVHKQACGWDPVSGVKIYQIPSDSKKATVTFGYDDNNQLVTNGNCPTRYKVDWEKNGNSGTAYIQLP